MSSLSSSRRARRHATQIKHRYAQRSKLTHALESMETRVLMSVAALVSSDSDSFAGGYDFTGALQLNKFDETGKVLLGATVGYSLLSHADFGGTGFINQSNTSGSASVNMTGSTTLVVPGASAGNPVGATNNPQTVSVAPSDTKPFGPFQTVALTDNDTSSDSKTLVMTRAEAITAGYVGAGIINLAYTGQATFGTGATGGAQGQFAVNFNSNGSVDANVDYLYITLGSISGLKFNDLNGINGQEQGETGLPGWTINLVGQEEDIVNPNTQAILYNGVAVNTSQVTGAGGVYSFTGLRPGTYTVTETQQVGWTQTFGSTYTITIGANGVATVGSNTGNDFGNHQPPQGGGAAATIGFWHNKNGRAVITSATGTSLTTWLSTNFPNLYGSLSGQQSLAVFNLFSSFTNGYFGAKGAKFSAQVMATALAVYFDSVNNTGAAQKFGFGGDLGSVLINVGTNGAAFNVANGTDISIFNALKAVDSHTVNGVINAAFRGVYNSFFSNINETFDI